METIRVVTLSGVIRKGQRFPAGVELDLEPHEYAHLRDAKAVESHRERAVRAEAERRKAEIEAEAEAKLKSETDALMRDAKAQAELEREAADKEAQALLAAARVAKEERRTKRSAG